MQQRETDALTPSMQAEFLYKNKPKLPQQWTAIAKDAIPLAIMIAPEEYRNGMVIVKEQRGKESEEGQGKGEVVKIDDMVAYVKSKLASS
jgi:histidyl-tRNA synthetase